MDSQIKIGSKQTVGLVELTGDQTIAGIKTFSSEIIAADAVKLSNTSTNGAGKIESLGTDIELFTSDGVIFRGVISGGFTYFQVGDVSSSVIFSAKNGTYFDEIMFNSTNSIFNGTVEVQNATASNHAVALGQLPVVLSGSATLDFPDTAPGNSSELTITVSGASDGDVVALGTPNVSTAQDTCFTARVSATNTVTVKFNNYSAVSVDPSSGVFKVKVFK